MKKCANCGKKLKASEVFADYNGVWFACMECWDKSEGFLGWLVETKEAQRGAQCLRRK